LLKGQNSTVPRREKIVQAVLGVQSNCTNVARRFELANAGFKRKAKYREESKV
jgi:hypothetical protein